MPAKRIETTMRILRAFTPMIAVYLVHGVFWLGYGAYERWVYFAYLAHFAGGFASAWTLALLYRIAYEKKLAAIRAGFIWWWGILSGVSLFAVLWEFHEYLLSLITSAVWQISIGETMGDIAFGLAGAIAFCAVYGARWKN